jgi:Tol biopolymer transport system component
MVDRNTLDFADEGRFLEARLRAWTDRAVSGASGAEVARTVARAHPRTARPLWLPELPRRAAWLGIAAALLVLTLAALVLGSGGGHGLLATRSSSPSATLRAHAPGAERPLLVVESGQIVTVYVDAGTTRHVGAGTSARLSPDGARISFVSPEGLGVMATNGARRSILTTDPCQLGPWSPDSSMVLAACGSSATPPFELFNLLDGSVRPLGGFTAFKDYGSGSWSPDGSEIALPGVGRDLLIVRTTAGEQTFTLPLGPLAWLPRWAPDGSAIAFASGGIYVIQQDNTRKRLLVAGVTPCELRWSPDSRSLAFTTPSSGCPAGGNSSPDARIVDLASGTIRSITSPVAGQAVRDLAWSSDGQRLALEVGPGRDCASGSSDSVWVVNADGSNPREVVDAVDCSWPDLGGPDW